MEKPNDECEVLNCVGIMLGLVDRPNEVVIGTIERVVKARTVHRMPVGQRGDAAYAKSIRGVKWQPNPAEVVGHGSSSYCEWSRWIAKPVENQIRREFQLAKYGFSGDCEGCPLAQLGAEAKPHSEGCRERIRQAMMKDDVDQQRLRAAEQRLLSAEEQPSVAT